MRCPRKIHFQAPVRLQSRNAAVSFLRHKNPPHRRFAAWSNDHAGFMAAFHKHFTQVATILHTRSIVGVTPLPDPAAVNCCPGDTVATTNWQFFNLQCAVIVFIARSVTRTERRNP